MKKIFLTIILLAVTIISPAQQKKIANPKSSQTQLKSAIPNGKIENGVYTCNLFQWQINIPNGYILRPEEVMKEQLQEGKAILKKTNPEFDHYEVATDLICFESSLHTYFSANYQVLKTAKMPLKEQQAILSKVFQNTSNFQGAHTTVTNSQLKLGKHDFVKIALEMYHPQLKLTKYQEVYMTYIDNYLFTAAINFMDEYDGKILRNNFFQSMETKN